MIYKVEIIKKTKGFNKGAIKSLTLENAKHLEKQGIGKIVKAKPVKNSIADLFVVVDIQSEEIKELKAKVEALELKVKEPEKLKIKK